MRVKAASRDISRWSLRVVFHLSALPFRCSFHVSVAGISGGGGGRQWIRHCIRYNKDCQHHRDCGTRRRDVLLVNTSPRKIKTIFPYIRASACAHFDVLRGREFVHRIRSCVPSLRVFSLSLTFFLFFNFTPVRSVFPFVRVRVCEKLNPSRLDFVTYRHRRARPYTNNRVITIFGFIRVTPVRRNSIITKTDELNFVEFRDGSFDFIRFEPDQSKRVLLRIVLNTR